jgi:hypothetical protein
MTTTEVRETEFSQNCFEVLVKAQEQNNTLLTYVVCAISLRFNQL